MTPKVLREFPQQQILSSSARSERSYFHSTEKPKQTKLLIFPLLLFPSR